MNSGDALGHANRGLARLLQGKSAEAERDFEQCLRLDASLKPRLEELIKQIKQPRMAKQYIFS
jgi:hypothetical protein